MIDRLLPLVLTLAVLTGGTLAIGSEFFSAQTEVRKASVVVTLPRVVITGSVQKDAVVAQREIGTQVR